MTQVHRALIADALARLERAAQELGRLDVAADAENAAADRDTLSDVAVLRLAAAIEAELDLRTHALTDGHVEMERHFAALSSDIGDARRQLDDWQRLLDDRTRAGYRDFREQAGLFLEHGGERAHRALRARLKTIDTLHGPTYHRDALVAVREIARATVSPWLRAAEEDAADWYRALLQWFIEMLEPVWNDLAPAYRDLCGLPNAPTLAAELSAGIRFQFGELTPVSHTPSTKRYFSDLFGGATARARINQESSRYLDWLLMLNVGQADNGLTDAVDRARRSLYLRVRTAFDETLTHAQRVRGEALRLRDDGALRIAAELTRLNRERAGLDVIREPFRHRGAA